MKKIILLGLCALSVKALAQDDLLSLVDNPTEEPHKKVYATFKTSKTVSAQTIETLKKRNLDFRVTHRFGNIYNEDSPHPLNDAGHSYFGIDNASDIRLSFDYGITDNLTVGIGRSKFRETYDASAKWKFLTQTVDNHIPVSICAYGDMGYTSMTTDNLFAGGVRPETMKESYRLSYFAQVIIARKFNNWLSLQVLPSYSHRNFIVNYVNSNGDHDQNDVFSLGISGRIKLTKRFAIVGDYFYNFRKFQQGSNPMYYNPLAVGIEIETGGHVFHINVTNANAILENNLVPYTSDTWTKGQIKLGFNISRIFVF